MKLTRDELLEMMNQKTNKYHAKKTTVDGIVFDSQKEANYYCELKMLKMAGVVKDFDIQVEFVLQPKFKYKGKPMQPIKYVADFVVEYSDGHKEVVDTKGVRTKDYLIKKKMLLYQNPNIIFVEA